MEPAEITVEVLRRELASLQAQRAQARRQADMLEGAVQVIEQLLDLAEGRVGQPEPTQTDEDTGDDVNAEVD